jgi:HSP20 family protein
MDQLKKGLNHLFDERSTGTPSAYPAVNIWTENDKAYVTAELPGISPSNVKLSILEQSITLEGTRNTESLPEGGYYHRRERGSGHFERTIQLPYPVDANRVNAQFNNGILTVTLPRSEANKPRKIEIKTN